MKTKQSTYVIKTKLKYDDNFIQGCLLLLYRHQTKEEKDESKTIHANQLGFNKADAPILTPLAEKLGEWGPSVLTPADMAEIRQRIGKYLAQIEQLLFIQKPT